MNAAGSRLTAAQDARRRRMLREVSALAAEGGYESVQMRDVAARADVAIGTLYRYFPSKEYLVASVMEAEVGALAADLEARPARGNSAGERVLAVLGRANHALLARPNVSIAQIRALVSGNDEVAEVVKTVTDAMRALIVAAMEAEPTDESIDVADTLFDVWLAALVGWISGMTEADEVQRKLARTVKQLLPMS
ncbi:MAG: TetR family transcriptional regulator [Candidatus Microthrix subdominans]|uniref:TetR family transcriptional regulator n=1 Tax=Candidatus Neomicrothrix subdominans TaxID=2954438 RepID=A0A936TFA5_9ACTN|nr:TetR family transcriptional regulator [Candidatus Microthrix sp.]MBK9297867.1 TetR family transcriptional regulator [Candidatus Microthrix subdominans]MBK6437297.1 TetR family transcriptional regulator [Candidatus Microthrix sp.]MBK6969724.1 TetR family transcriptional regulator [Candidatus Microthrix sp.]MBK9559361.1 TetR family transcriptional regulator [Candidatus Microthrix sp.]HMS45947.1 TetR family transcriptional regulator [Candidatus Microthrix sp.]